jgi:hypothetical protein
VGDNYFQVIDFNVISFFSQKRTVGHDSISVDQVLSGLTLPVLVL